MRCFKIITTYHCACVIVICRLLDKLIKRQRVFYAVIIKNLTFLVSNKMSKTQEHVTEESSKVCDSSKTSKFTTLGGNQHSSSSQTSHSVTEQEPTTPIENPETNIKGEIIKSDKTTEHESQINEKIIEALTKDLFAAVTAGKLEVVKHLLDNGANVHFRDNTNWTPLHAAASADKLEVAKYLVDKGADINSQDHDGWTPLRVAANIGNFDIVKYFIGKGVDINSQDNDGCTSLHGAAQEGRLDVLEYLFDEGADINSQDNEEWTPLYIASQEGELDVVKFLIDKGADINSKTDDGRTPLHTAAEEGRLEVVEYLLHKGASVNSQDADGCTPMHAAAKAGELDILRCLLYKEPNPEFKKYYCSMAGIFYYE